MKAFLTGATGFIGVRVARRLIASRHDIRCLVRRPSAAAQELKALGATLVNGGLDDTSVLTNAMRGCTGFIHLAGLYSFWERDPDRFRTVNVLGTRTVMECALAADVPKVVHVSTVGVFGRPDEAPFHELSEPGPVRFGRYFQTKAEGDEIVWGLHRSRGLPVVMVYPAAVLGPGDPKATGQYIRDLMERRLPATVFDSSVLTLVHVDDVAEVIVRAAEKEGNIGERYIAGAERMTFREIGQLIAEISGVSLPRLHLPGWMAMLNAHVLTWLSGLTGKPPLWGMSVDQMSVMRVGFSADGSKAVRELGVIYTPVRKAVAEAIESFQKPPPSGVR